MTASHCGAPDQWHAVCNPCVKSRRWDDGLVVYSVNSGDTFLFGLPAFSILDRLAAGPAAAAELGAAADEEELRELLARLEQAGLVVRTGHADRRI